MSDALGADKNQGLPSCYLDFNDATQLIVATDGQCVMMVYFWDDYSNRHSEEIHTSMSYFLN